MATIKNIELIDDVRTDAKRLMEENPNLDYFEAYEQAKQNLIGNEEIINYEYTTFSDNLVLEKDNEKNNEDAYYNSLRTELSDKIDTEKYSNEQIEQYAIADGMGLDISKFANPIFSAEQIKFMSIAVVSGQDITYFLNNPDFDPDSAMKKLQEID